MEKTNCKLGLRKTDDPKDSKRCYSLYPCERCDDHIEPGKNQFMGGQEQGDLSATLSGL